jgi:hypothetical protein
VDLIQKSEVRIDEDATEATYRALVDIFDPEMPVVRRGVPGFWFAPWDVLVRWTGIEEALVDLSDRPDYIHAAMDRLVEVLLDRLDQCERLGVVALNSTNVRIGSGAYGYSSEVPGDDFDSGSIRTADLWGSATAQIFGVVSPRMHEEFALRYEKKWMERFGLNYYGCCEPLHDKIDILEEVPNLRKISMSPWADLDVATSKMGDRHVYSVKLNPACVAEEGWDAEHVRSDLREKLAILDGCAVEIVLKDISTVKGDPQRLWEWAAIASEVAAEYAS